MTDRVNVPVEGGHLSVLHYANPDRPRLLFAHANGFNAQTYSQVFAHLAPHYEIIAPDTRGHGLSQAATDPSGLRDWHGFARDLIAVSAYFEPRPTVFAGHSMGSVCALLAVGQHGLKVDRMAFIEPVFMPTGFYAIPRIPGGPYLYQFNPMSGAAKSRRSSWPSRQDVIASYSEKRLFRDWAPGVLEDYLATGLRDGEGEVHLSCAPEWEAAIFASHGYDPWAALSAIDVPLAMIKAGKPGSTVYPAWRLRRRGIPLETMEDAGHLAPMSHPEACARWLLDKLKPA